MRSARPAMAAQGWPLSAWGALGRVIEAAAPGAPGSGCVLAAASDPSRGLRYVSGVTG